MKRNKVRLEVNIDSTVCTFDSIFYSMGFLEGNLCAPSCHFDEEVGEDFPSIVFRRG